MTDERAASLEDGGRRTDDPTCDRAGGRWTTDDGQPPSSPLLLGIRHHGPGSARSVRQALEQYGPDIILVEGPPDGQVVMPLAGAAGMRPPVALLIYAPADPRQAVYYPFAVFSPEWQAILYGLNRAIPVRFMDLPQANVLALAASLAAPEPGSPPGETGDSPAAALAQDPLGWVAEAAGYSDGERWWEHLVEQRRDSTDLFQAILELMTSLREEVGRAGGPPLDPMEPYREAAMRQAIRAAQAEGYSRIAVVCGAWHGPALATLSPATADARLLRGLPRLKVTATWIPWTYGRLTARSGYGAGIQSPGYYHHLWSQPDQVTVRWLTRVAHLLREQDLAALTAGVIEAVRLAESLAALRGRPLPGLPELNEAALAVFCFGDTTPLKLIGEKLIVGEALGDVPAETPMLPLLQDLQREQKRLRLPAEAVRRRLDLDLRKPNDLERSYLLHRLALLGIGWGQPERATGKGTFHEIWGLQWQPEFSLAVIEANRWGNTVPAAASAYTAQAAAQTGELPALTGLAERALLANLPEAIGPVIARLQEVAALTSDVPHLMAALPSLANVLRYGSVRQTDTGMIGSVVDGLVARICIGLPGACAALNDDAARVMFDHLNNVHQALATLQVEAYSSQWQAVLNTLADSPSLHGLLAGRCCRLLFDQAHLLATEAARRMNLALSPAVEPVQAAAWLEGFLHGSGLILLHNDSLWQILDDWTTALPAETFTTLLPLLRRTFAAFAAPERRQMGERARQTGQPVPPDAGAGPAIDPERADQVLPLLAQLLGLEMGS